MSQRPEHISYSCAKRVEKNTQLFPELGKQCSGRVASNRINDGIPFRTMSAAASATFIASLTCGVEKRIGSNIATIKQQSNSNLIAMAPNLIAKAPNLIAMASNLMT